MLISLTVGKVDAGVAVLLTDDKRIIEFPSILLPPDIHSGSIVDVNVSRNLEAETHAQKSFHALQSSILAAFGSQEPSVPVLRCRNATQTSVVLEWDPISLATADLRGLTLYRNGSKAGTIPRPFEMTATKISGLAVNCEYSFNLVLRTSAGTYSSDKLTVTTHKMTDLNGVTVTPGVMPAQTRESLEETLDRMGAKLSEQVRIDTTHFVCTEERGPAFEKAREMNIPVVVPDWVKGCEREGRIVGVRGYYLNADPKLRQMSTPGTPAQGSQHEAGGDRGQEEAADAQRAAQTPRTEITPPTPDAAKRPDDEEEDEEGDGEEEDEHDEKGEDGETKTDESDDEVPAQSVAEKDSDADESKSLAEDEGSSAKESWEQGERQVEKHLPKRTSSLGKKADEGGEEGGFDDVKL